MFCTLFPSLVMRWTCGKDRFIHFLVLNFYLNLFMNSAYNVRLNASATASSSCARAERTDGRLQRSRASRSQRHPNHLQPRAQMRIDHSYYNSRSPHGRKQRIHHGSLPSIEISSSSAKPNTRTSACTERNVPTMDISPALALCGFSSSPYAIYTSVC